MSERQPHDPEASPVSTPETPPVSTSVQIPHSGVRRFELPVRNFDNTPLNEAVERGLVRIPDSPAPLGDHTESTPRRRPKRWQVISVISATAAALAAGFAVANNDRGDHPITTIVEVDTEPTVTQPTPDNSPADTSTPEAQPTQDNRLSPETLAELSREEMVATGKITVADAPTADRLPYVISAHLSAISSAGTNTDPAFISHQVVQSRADIDAYTEEMIEQYARPFMEGMFTNPPTEFTQTAGHYGRQLTFLNMVRVGLMPETSRYVFTSEVREGTVTITPIGANAYEIVWYTHDSDNYEEVVHLVGGKPLNADAPNPYHVSATLVDGTWELTRL